MSNICILGDVLVDISLKAKGNPLKMRLGGIVHAARALWAMNIQYTVAYFAPNYLDSSIKKYLAQLGNPLIIKLGDVESCPYVMLIEEVKEVGDQGYEFLLREDIKISYNEAEIQKLNQFDEIFLISGNYDFDKIGNSISRNCKLHYDAANNIYNFSCIEKHNYKFETIFISTSSPFFKSQYSEATFSINSYFHQFERLCRKIILKENRGGSRAYNFKNRELINIPAQTQKVIHSVGVGDVYDVVYIALYQKYNLFETLSISSWVAAEYAKTTLAEHFKKNVYRILKINVSDIKSLGGCFLPWELRKKCHIYIAAPDFDFVNTAPIDLLERSLLYHNFVPHRPIQEIGQMEDDASNERKKYLCNKDIILLGKCNMLIAVLLYNDPGSLIEIGLAVGKKIPTIVYDPYNIATNCMLTQLPDKISSDLDEILSEVFISYSKIIS